MRDLDSRTCGLCIERLIYCVYKFRQNVDETTLTTSPDVTNDAVPRKSKRRQPPSSTQPAAPDVASCPTVTSPVSAIERLDNLIKVLSLTSLWLIFVAGWRSIPWRPQQWKRENLMAYFEEITKFMTSLDKFHQVMSLVVMVCGHRCWTPWVVLRCTENGDYKSGNMFS